jgi:sirohydrochlorin cobaltochelatase
VVDDRLAAVVPADLRATTAVVLVGRGAYDPDANADIAKVARLLWEGRRWPIVEPAYISLTTPSVQDAMERCRRLGATRIAVVPYFLFAGVLPDRVGTQALEYAAAHPELDVVVAAAIGGDDRVAELALERYAEAVGGDIRMNCDACIYRVAMPGYESRLGAPQTPHDHPADRRCRAVRHQRTGTLRATGTGMRTTTMRRAGDRPPRRPARPRPPR